MERLMIPIRLAFLDLLDRWKLSLVMIMVLLVPITAFLVVTDYQRVLQEDLFQLSPDILVISQSNGFGEVYGSRLSPEVGEVLKARGVSWVVPEINDITGTSVENALIVHGVHLPDYRQATYFQMVTGRALEPGDAPRLTMVGYRLATKNKTAVGDQIDLRGRLFTVIGIFRVGTYADNGAWISLEDAQKLLNYGQDVSLYLIPNEGIIKPGQKLMEGVSVGRKGESSMVLGQEFKRLPDYLGLVANALGVVAALTLGNILWRMAWLRRRQFGVLRGLGFGSRFIASYLTIQAVFVSGAAFLAALLLATTVGKAMTESVTVFGMNVALNLSATSILSTLFWTGAIVVVGILFPLFGINRLSTVQLVSSEESF
jgi:ABC-type lipoprotein release transport system permease subunit